MRVLVTGGAGFLGSHVAGRFVAEGHAVRVLDDLSTGRRPNLPAGAELLLEDVRDAEAVERAVAGVDLVFHFAAAVGAKIVADDPVGTWSRNVDGAARVMEAAARHGTRLVLASSSEVYGPGRRGPLREDDAACLLPTGRREVYALSKAAGEAYALALHRARGLAATVVRLFNVVGPRQSDRYGMVVPRFVTAARAGRPLPVYGDGTQRRCFLHVEDAVDALLALVEVDAARGQVVNVGTEEEIAIVDLARLVAAACGSRAGYELVPFERVYGRGFVDPPARVPDVSRLRRWTGLRPRRCVEQAVHDILAAPSALHAGTMEPA